MPKNTSENKGTERPPIIVVMGHIDHGKSTLLDYIRNTNIVAEEAGGITQRMSAYEVIHKDQHGEEKRITFLDTPGHEAFQKMRSRGSDIADIAILVVSAEEGVKPQTLEALSAIKESKIPYIVAITKIDKPNANVERAKQSLLEHEIYLEGMGGDIPYVPVSSKRGDGIPELLDMTLLVAELEELRANPEVPAEGRVIEAHQDPRKGVFATLIITEGTLRTGDYVVAGSAYSPVRALEDFRGEKVTEATFSSPVRVSGFSELPEIGTNFKVAANKKEAEKEAEANRVKPISSKASPEDASAEITTIPIVLKADASGMLDAIEHEIAKLHYEGMAIKVLHKSVGAISEGDVKAAGSDNKTLIVGFNVKVDAPAQELAERVGIEIGVFDIIYKLAEWLDERMRARKPIRQVDEVVGRAKVLKIFSSTNKGTVLGARMELGKFALGARVKVLRNNVEIGKGTVENLKQQKADIKEITEGNEFGAQIDATIELSGGDILESTIRVEK